MRSVRGRDTTNAGNVAVGGMTTGEIETGDDFDWFAVELVGGRTHVIDLKSAKSQGKCVASAVIETGPSARVRAVGVDRLAS